MYDNAVIFSLFLIFSGAAVLSTAALFTRQSLLIAYMLLGVLLGPWGLKLLANADLVQQTGDIGIIFLLFLLGLHLQPQNLISMLRKTVWVTVISSTAFLLLGTIAAYFGGYSLTESLIVGAALMFSSTIVGLKLLPSSVLHHQRTGEIMVSVLLLQDLLAIFVLLYIHSSSLGGLTVVDSIFILLALPTLLVFAFLVQRLLLIKLFSRFEKVREYVFLLAIAWCLALSQLAVSVGLSYEIGAFIAGISLAASPIAVYIAENLKPLRDFFLVMFFFSIGASFDVQYYKVVIFPAIIISLLVLLAKPLAFRLLLRQVNETKHVAWEVGLRMGQISEFSLLVAYLAGRNGMIGESAEYLIQGVTMLTFIVSSYIVVMYYPTPMASVKKIQKEV